MFSMRVTPVAKTAILEQFALMELSDPGLFIYREPAEADVLGSADGQSKWSIQRGVGYRVLFMDMPPLESPNLLVADGIRVFQGPMDTQPPNTAAIACFQNGRLYIEDRAEGGQANDVTMRGDGIRLGLIPKEVIVSSSGNHRFHLLFISRGGGGSHFHSIRYEAENGGDWTTEVSLTQKQFQGKHEFHRWVQRLHPVQDDSGVALIQVGEDSRRIGDLGPTWASYSWRAWDLRRNVELRRLKDCRNPFEAFE
jgi:hypothetical protein